MSAAPTSDFDNLRVVAFENRKGKEIAALISKQRGIPLIAPAMREVPLEENPEAFAFAEELFSGRIDAVIFMTGVGARALIEVLQTRHSLEKVIAGISAVTVVVRGPKPVAVLREFKIPIHITVPEPNTWREVLATLDDHPGGFEVKEKRVAVQEYGVENPVFIAELEKRGAHVTRVPVYRWGMPQDLAPLREALRAIVAGEARVLLFTNAIQVESVLQIAAQDGLDEQFRAALQECAVCSVGPTCSETLAAHNIRVDIQPEHPKMGPLVLAAAQKASGLLRSRTAG
jgi:uroporphyrinogen-III synthase